MDQAHSGNAAHRATTESLPKAVGLPDAPSAPLLFLIALSMAAFLAAIATARGPESGPAAHVSSSGPAGSGANR
jgi:hypothetical protein